MDVSEARESIEQLREVLMTTRQFADELGLSKSYVYQVIEGYSSANERHRTISPYVIEGGVRGAVRAIHAARAHGMETMLGCMVSSNALIAAGMGLAPLVDYADLDGAMLLADGTDPYRGLDAPGGRIDLSSVERPGTGARERTDGQERTSGDDTGATGGGAA